MKLNELLELIEVDTKIKVVMWGGGINEPFYHKPLYTGVVYTCRLEKFKENKIIDVSLNLMHQLVINISDKKDGDKMNVKYNSEINKDNIKKFKIGSVWFDTDNEKFKCVICERNVSISNSCSLMGNRLICNNCVYEYFGDYAKAREWQKEGDNNG